MKGYDYEGHSSRCAPQDVLVAHSPWDGSLLHVVKEACWSALTENSCNTVDEPEELSELPPSVLEQAFGPQVSNAAAAAPQGAQDKPKKKRYVIMADELVSAKLLTYILNIRRIMYCMLLKLVELLHLFSCI